MSDQWTLNGLTAENERLRAALARYEQAELPEEPPVMSCSLHEGWFRETDYYALRAHAAKVTVELAAANERAEIAEGNVLVNHDMWQKAYDRAEAAERRADENARLLSEAQSVLRECRGTLQVDQHDGHRRIAKKIENTCGRIDAARNKEGKT